MNNKFSPIVIVFLGILLFNLLWPLIKALAVLALIVAVVFGIYVFVESRKVKKEIEQDPQVYFSQQVQNQREKIKADVIDVEYKEREVKEVDND